MTTCLIIPCYNHTERLQELIDSAAGLRVFVIDDGSVPPVRAGGCRLVRLERNSGKAAALARGFCEAEAEGFDHAITMDADGQHDPTFIPRFLDAAEKFPDAIITGVRDFNSPMISGGRRFMNKFSNFWFKSETGVDIEDTQCGYRCYPLKLIKGIAAQRKGYTYELEILVKFSWLGGRIEQVEIPTIYTKESLSSSHYKPFWDTLRFTLLNTKLFFASKLLPRALLKRLAKK